MSTAVVITTFNEIDGVKELLPKIKKEWAEEWLVVDGNSNDGTIDQVKKLGFNIALQNKKGHGDAVARGVSDTKSEFIVYWGPDGNHELQEIPTLIEKIKEGFDQVIISRFGKTSVNLDAGHMDTFGNKMFTFLVNCFFGGHWTDMLNGNRIISRKAFNELKYDAMGMDTTQQMSVRGLTRRQKICEIIGNEGKRIGGKRKMRPLSTGASLSWGIIKEFIFWKM